MIVIAGTLTIEPEALADFREALAAMRPQVLGEAGVLHYSLLVQEEATGQIGVCEIWESDAALEAHFGQPWIRSFSDRFMPSVIASSLQIYDIAGVRPLVVG